LRACVFLQSWSGAGTNPVTHYTWRAARQWLRCGWSGSIGDALPLERAAA
jgi:hypothetical protein